MHKGTAARCKNQHICIEIAPQKRTFLRDAGGSGQVAPEQITPTFQIGASVTPIAERR
jgi:hypothetical protein